MKMVIRKYGGGFAQQYIMVSNVLNFIGKWENCN